ncbi:hypothetical protein, partial [Escherichia coli]|uniref:hypothetical protein n=1 Tax=Escherichia coli TaxID=562 RepID=UPI0032E3AEE4
KAQTSILTVNPVSGIAELISAPVEGSVPPQPAVVVPADTATGPAYGNGLLKAGYTPSYLFDELGIPERTGAAAIGAASVEAFELVVTDDAVPEWQGLALIDLEAGKSLQEVKEGLGIGDYVDDPTKSEDEKLAEALEHPASKLEFTYAEGFEDLEYVINNESFQDWLVFLHPAQA